MIEARPFGSEEYAVPGIYLASAARHPLPTPIVGVLKQLADTLATQAHPQRLSDKQAQIRTLFARLINADPAEVALVPSTVMAENFILNALALPDSGRAIVTDVLHFSGSLDLYRALADGGAPVTILPLEGMGIDYNRLEDALGSNTGLIALSSVSHRTGFMHDLKTICSLAHAKGTLVYADIIQQAGTLPLDVRESGVDFCACASYKWLLGDMGLGFLYVRRDRWPLLKRILAGPAQCPSEEEGGLDPSSRFHIGTLSGSATEALLHSLPRTIAFMAGNPAEIWLPLVRRIEARFEGLGLTPITPREAHAPIRAYESLRLTNQIIGQFRERGVRANGSNGFLRLSPSSFNSVQQIDQAADIMDDLLRS